jgi:hypothetical protein
MDNTQKFLNDSLLIDGIPVDVQQTHQAKRGKQLSLPTQALKGCLAGVIRAVMNRHDRFPYLLDIFFTTKMRVTIQVLWARTT